MGKERFLTVLIPIRDDDCESGTYTVGTLPSPVAENINKIYIMDDGTYRRLWYNNGTLEYHAVVDREFPYLGEPLEIFDFTYSATRMGQSPTISAQGIMRFVDSAGNTLDGLWSQECHVTFNGENLYLKQIPNASKSNEDARYKYDMDFVSEDVVLERVYLYDVVTPFITEKPISESSVFSFYGDASELAKRINASLIRSELASLVRKYVGYPTSPSNIVPYLTYEQWTMMNVNPSSLIGVVFANAGEMQVFGQSIYVALNADYNQYLQQYIYQNTNGDYTVNGYKVVFGIDKYGEVSSSEEKLVSIENATVHEALQQFYDTFELQYYITKEKDSGGNFTGNTLIVVGDCEHDFADWDEDNDDYVRDDDGVPTTENPFDYGSTKELLSKEKTNTTEKIVTRITGVGSTENIPWHYPNPSPDGWIRPFFTEHGIEQPNALIDYPTSEGTTQYEYAIYEKFLKNRIGVPIKRGVLRQLIYKNEYKACNTEWQTAPNTPNMLLIHTIYNIDVSDFGLVIPRITLEMSYDTTNSGISKVTSRLTRGNTEVGTYDSSQTYQDPTDFQSMFIDADGKHKQNLGGGYNYFLDIVYHIPESAIPLSEYCDYEGYKYESHTYNFTDSSGNHPPQSYTDYNGKVHNYTGYYTAYLGSDFYSEEGLIPFVKWNEVVTYNGVYEAYLHTISAVVGYSTDGTINGKVSPIPRRSQKQYKDLSDGTIYKCTTSSSHPIDTYNGNLINPFNSNPLQDEYEWLRRYVYNLVIRLYDNDGWYINNNKVVLSDYGLSDPYMPGGYVALDIFNAIEFQRLKWVTPQPNLMPEVYIKTDGEKRFYVAHDYYDKENHTLLAGTADTAIGEEQVGSLVRNPLYKDEETDTDDKHYDFENEFVKNLPHEHIENFDDEKPTIKEQKAYVKVEITQEIIDDWANQYNNYFVFEDGDYVQAPSTYDSSIKAYYMLLRIDVVEEFAYDEYDSDEIWESNDAGSIQGEYKHPYFFARLRPMGFNIFDMALQEDMVLSMTTGDCGACNFKIGVDENYRKNPVQLWEYDVYDGDNLQATKLYDKGSLRRYINLTGLYYNKNGVFEAIAQYSNDEELGKKNGELPSNFDDNKGIFYTYNYTGVSVESGMVGVTKKAGNTHIEGDVVTSGRFLDEQQDTSENYVWVALFKDTDSYGTIMPSAVPNYNDPNYNLYMRPKSIADVHTQSSTYTDDEDNADKFVLTNIRLPQVYLRRAEHELSRKLVRYMYDNNFQKFNFNIKFSRIYIEENPHTDEDLNENSVLYVDFNRAIYRQYVKNYTYKMVHTEALPEITVAMNEKLSVSRTLEQRRRRDGKISDGRTSLQISSVVNRMREKIESRTINKDNNQIMSGNIIIQGENTSLVELARKRYEGGETILPSVPSPADAVPLMDGSAAIGTSDDYAREDHVHPTDTSRAADNAVVHKTGNESISGEKTFNNGIFLNNSTFTFLDGQDSGVYIDEGEDSSGTKMLLFSDVEDDSSVRLGNVALPTQNSDAANKAYVDGLLNDNNAVYLNGRSFSSGIQPWSLCAFSLSAGGTVMYMTSFTGTGGNGGGAPLTSVQFPIGCKIYYYPSDISFGANTDFVSKKFYTTYKEVDARYSSVTGSSLNLGSSSTSSVYLRVLIDNGYWKPYYKTGSTTEIIVTSNQLSQGDFYIYLGKKIGTDAYTFQLEDNNPLYYYDGNNLIDWASYKASITVPAYTAGDGISINNNVISCNRPYKKELFSSNSFNTNSAYSKGWQNYAANLDAGVYKVTMQVHLYIVSGSDNMMPNGCVVNVYARNRVSSSSNYNYIFGATETLGSGAMPELNIPTGRGIISRTLCIIGFMEVTGEETSDCSVEVGFTTNSTINVQIGDDVPLDGSQEGQCSGNNFILFEKL